MKSRYVDNKYQVGRIVFQSLFIQLKLLRISYSDEKTILYGETRETKGYITFRNCLCIKSQ